MTDAVVPTWHGNNYQARVFWDNALNLFDPTSCVVEVTFEADGPKAFDDVVVKYHPAVARSGPERILADYHQVKWHTESGGRFGYQDLIEPAFIGAQTFSLLQRLYEARRSAGGGSCFTFVTTYRITDGDPLAVLVSGNDRSLLVEKLFDGTTDRSRMGSVRKLWREHLKLTNDEELREVVAGLRILEGYRSLDELRAQINIKAKLVGLMTSSDANSAFLFDELARQLKARRLNKLTRELLEQICREEKLYSGEIQETDSFLAVAIRSFLGPPADVTGAMEGNTLLLTDSFRQRYLRDDRDWQKDVRPRVEDFLRQMVTRSSRLRLILDAHASIAFIAGSVLDLKSGVTVELVQKGRVGSKVWRADDSAGANSSLFNTTISELGPGRDISVGISVAQSVDAHARSYTSSRLGEVGKYISFVLPSGPGAQTVLGGQHAAMLADQIANVIRAVKSDLDAVVHIFAACPNALLFFLGQQHRGIAPCVVYEFDFDRRGDKTYQPSFVID